MPLPLHDTDPLALVTLAEAVAREAAAAVALAASTERVGVETKSTATDLVTETDRATERLIVDRLLEARPDDGLIGEEGAGRPGTTGVVWVIDPIDGTTSFAYGYPAYAVSIGVEVDGTPVAGCVVDVVRNEAFTATLGGGARSNGRPIHVRPPGPPLSQALVATGFGYAAERRVQQAKVLGHVLPRVRDIRRAGSAALDLCWMAAGRVDATYELGLEHWDHAAGALIAAEAGAAVTTLGGGPLHRDATIVTARPDLLDALLALLEEAGAAGVT
jgi:myo-inositol-1(or 4)-monophosphatase